MDRLDEMRVFSRIVELGSFTRAAKDLALPRATVTLAMQRLEARLGVRLLHRTTREVSATSEGQLFHRSCARLLADLESAEAELLPGDARPRGTVRVHMVSNMAARIVIPALPEFHERHPRVTVAVGTGDRLVDLAREGVDCALRGGPVNTPGLVVRRLAPLPQVTCASAIYLARRGEPRSLEALADHHAVNYLERATGKPYPLHFMVRGEPRSVFLPSLLRVTESEAHLAGGLAHFGLFQAPTYALTPHLAEGRLREVLAHIRPPPLPFSLVHPYSRRVPPRVRVFLDWLVLLLGRHFGAASPVPAAVPENG